MRIRRCAVLMLEPREEARFALDDLLAGGNGLRRTLRWLALAGHLDAPVEVDAAERELLGQASPTEWLDPDGLPEALAAAVPRLVAEGLLLEEAPADPAASDADARLRELCWWTPSAVAHRHGRWQGVDGAGESERAGLLTVEGLESRFGPPPPHVAQTGTGPGAPRQPLPRTPDADFDRLLARRATCRNFDTARPLDQARFATMLQRVFGARAHVDAGTGATFLKKGSPSGGGLHSTGAYLLVRNVEDVAPGLYHYHPVEHALEPLPAPEAPLDELALLALSGQHWFADAPVLAALVPRFARSYWKYRHHPKAYRALVLDAGHLSQTLYLSATELGLGAFVTSAINEVDIERAFGLDPLEESPLAVCGFGWRARRMETAEFDPAGEVWEVARVPTDPE